VQFPPPPLFLYMRLQTPQGVKRRLTPLIAKGLRRIRAGPVCAKKRQQTSVRGPGALPKALPIRYPNTGTWPLSWPLGPSCPRPFAPASSLWSRPPRSECIQSCQAWQTGASDNLKPRCRYTPRGAKRDFAPATLARNVTNREVILRLFLTLIEIAVHRGARLVVAPPGELPRHQPSPPHE
jgi:hypothetical protein